MSDALSKFAALKCSFTVLKSGRTLNGHLVVWIEDNNFLGNMSVTNDAKAVCEALHSTYPQHQIIYKDSTGAWAVMRHYHGQFSGFAPADAEDMLQ